MSCNGQGFANQVMHFLLMLILYLHLALAVDQISVEADSVVFCGTSLRQGRRHKVPLMQVDVLSTQLPARLTLVRVVVQMEDRAVCTEDVELPGLRYGSKSVVLCCSTSPRSLCADLQLFMTDTRVIR